MIPQDMEVIAEAFVEDRLRSGDDELLESVLKQQDVDDIAEIDISALSEKQLDWMEDILKRAQQD